MIGRSSRPLTVQLPPASSDRPSWIKVGVIAVVGFGVGVVWPRLAGIRPGPSAPTEATASAGTASMRAPEALPSTSATASDTEAAASATASATPSAEAAVPLNNAPPAILVTHGAVLSCKSADGEAMKGQACGTVPAFDGIAQPRLKRLAHCPGAQGLSGKLSVVFGLDFVRNKINFSYGKSTVANKDTRDGCLRMSLENVSLNAIAHDN